MIIKGRSICQGLAKGVVVKYEEPFSFLGGVDGSTGELRVRDGNIAGKVFVFPKGKGSTVGSFVMYDLKVHGNAPVAVINRSAETIVTTGAVISSIPMVDNIDVDILKDGDQVIVNGTDGSISLENVKCIRTVSSVILVDGKVLILHRPDTARSFPGRHSFVSGKIESNESEVIASKREIFEETQIIVGEPDAVLGPMYVRENEILWEVTPFLYKLNSAEPILNHENVAFKWLTPDEIKNDPKMVPLAFEALRSFLKL